MNKQIELEYKMILTPRQFSYIKNKYPFTYPVKQTNYYFDNPSKELSEKRYALRIREIDNSYILTLKIPQKIGVLELEQEIPAMQIQKELLSQPLQDALSFLQISELSCFGSLTTYRSTLDLPDAVVCLDENFYHNHHDYEIEYEVKNDHDSYPAFLSFLRDCKIRRHVPAKGKARRVKQAVHFL